MFLAAILLFQAAPQCPATDAALPANLSGWTAQADGFGVNRAVTLDAGDVAKLPSFPAEVKPGGAVMIGFRIKTTGRYGIALDQRGWVDVVSSVSRDEVLKSKAHGHGPDCSSIRKIVRFDLQPGIYRLYVTGLATPTVKVMLVAP